jgi:hypothetical protein
MVVKDHIETEKNTILDEVGDYKTYTPKKSK